MGAKRVAIVDLGTNSTRLLVADVEDGAVREIERRTNVTRLGEGVDSSGRLSDAAMQRVLDVLAGYRRLIDHLGAERVAAVATSAMRDAENGPDFQLLLAERLGIEARVIPGEEEARLTFRGATSARGERDVETSVVDIGGGSTEFVVGEPDRDPRFHVSAKLGSVRQSERHLRSDPPVAEEVEALSQEARRIVEEEVPAGVRESVDAGIAVAGTATSLAAIDLELDPYDPERVHGHVLGLGAAESILARLAALPLAERREVTGLHPDRAPTIVAGAAILVESMRAFGLGAIEVSEADLLQGAALAVAESD
jgi:exopolyphosphatase / guanosine-5'-triphosphate,3'-diphosphate pyrophosphatase